MGFFNSGGLITRGYGDNHRIITRGMSVKFDFGGIGPLFRKEPKEYDLKILVPILKEISEEIKIYSPLEIRKDKEISINSSVYGEIDLNLIAKLEYSLLIRILDAI